LFAITVKRVGGSEVLEWKKIQTPEPAEGQLLIDIVAAGVNYLEIYHRSGIYEKELPFVPGGEGAGIVRDVGPGVTKFSVGDLVASVDLSGSYAEQAVVDAKRAVSIPEGLSGELAAATLLQGMTAHYLCHDAYALQANDLCLIHAGAGGVGRILIQMAKQIGATVFTTVSTKEKAALAHTAGADHIINYVKDDFTQAIEQVVGKRALAAVYDGVGAATFDKGLTLLRPTGTMVLFGQSSGVVPPFDLGRLATEGSLYITRPTLTSFIANEKALERRFNDVLTLMQEGHIDIQIGHRYRLKDARQAHEDLESRRTTGKLVLIP